MRMDSVTLFWLLMGVVLLVAEIAVPGFVLFFFSVGAFLTLGIIKLIPPLSGVLWLQLIIWVCLSSMLFFFLRKKFSGTFKGRMFKTEKEDWIGREAEVISLIKKDEPGRIKFRGTTWNAHSSDLIKKGKTVKIIGKSGTESFGFTVEEVK